MTRRYRALVLFFSLVAGAPAAHAVPAFARQMGMPCSACHFQHFPLLNELGQAFKDSGFTMSTTSMIEDSSGMISLPSNLNLGVFTNVGYQKTNGPTTIGHDSNTGVAIIPGETSLFMGGRVADHVGALVEGDLTAGAAAGTPFLASFKIPVMFDVMDMKVGGVVYSSGLGPAYGFEKMSTGAVGNHIMNLRHPDAVSAQQYLGTALDSEGVAFVATTHRGFINFSKWSPNRLASATGTSAVALDSSYLRAAYMPAVDGWDVGVGFQYWGGSTLLGSDLQSSVWAPKTTKAEAVDAQAQGQVSGIPLGVYASYAVADKSTADAANLFNAGPRDRKAAVLAMEAGLFDGGRGTLQLAYRIADSGDAQYYGDKALTIGAGYMMAINVYASVTDTYYMGGMYSGDNPNHTNNILSGASGPGGNNLVSANIGMGF